MKRILASGAAIAALCAAATGAHAQAIEGVYVGADVGYSWTNGISGKSNVVSPAGGNYEWKFDREDTPAGFLRLGARVAPNWRVELEGGYRNGDIESVRGRGTAQPIGLCTAGIGRTTAAPTCGAPVGELRVGSLMANVIYDFMPDSKLNPFVGLGVGAIEVHNKVFGQLSGVPAGGQQYQNVSFDDVEQATAAQGIIGVSYALAPNWNLDVTGRYLMSDDMNFNSLKTRAGGGAGAITDTGRFNGHYNEATATVGVRYTFGSAPPPPPPPPPPPRPPEASPPPPRPRRRRRRRLRKRKRW